MVERSRERGRERARKRWSNGGQVGSESDGARERQKEVEGGQRGREV